MTDGMWQMSRPDLEARIAELEAENKIFRSDVSGLEAAVNGLIAEKAKLEAENNRLRDGASSNEVQRIWKAATQLLTVDQINAISTRVLELRKEGFPREEAKHG